MLLCLANPKGASRRGQGYDLPLSKRNSRRELGVFELFTRPTSPRRSRIPTRYAVAAIRTKIISEYPNSGSPNFAPVTVARCCQIAK